MINVSAAGKQSHACQYQGNYKGNKFPFGYLGIHISFVVGYPLQSDLLALSHTKDKLD